MQHPPPPPPERNRLQWRCTHQYIVFNQYGLTIWSISRVVSHWTRFQDFLLIFPLVCTVRLICRVMCSEPIMSPCTTSRFSLFSVSWRSNRLWTNQSTKCVPFATAFCFTLKRFLNRRRVTLKLVFLKHLSCRSTYHTTLPKMWEIEIPCPTKLRRVLEFHVQPSWDVF